MAVTTTYRTNAVATAASSITLSTVAIGTADAGRMVFAGAEYLIVGGAVIPTCTIQGISAPVIAHIEGTSSTSNGAVIFGVNVPTGTTADVIVTKGGATDFNRIGVGVWSMIGANNTVYDTAVAETATVAISTTIDDIAGGALIGVSWTSASNPGETCTWTGIANEDFDTAVSGNVSYSGAHEDTGSTILGGTILATWTGVTTNQALLCVVSYQSAGGGGAASTFLPLLGVGT